MSFEVRSEAERDRETPMSSGEHIAVQQCRVSGQILFQSPTCTDLKVDGRLIVPIWSAERTISCQQAIELLFEQFPQLDPVRVEEYGHGWDNTAFLVNGEYMFRFPRRERRGTHFGRSMAKLMTRR